MQSSTLPLRPHEEALWQKYVAAVGNGQRAKALAALNAFMEALRTYPAAERHAWVVAYCQARLDEGQNLPAQYPLVVRVLIPELRQGVEARRPPCARWLAQLIDGKLHSAEVRQALGRPSLWSVEPLLREAVELDPTDRRARAALMNTMGHRFHYYTCGVPAGVGADPDKFRQELAEFAALATAQGEVEDWAEVLGMWQFHCAAWADYLTRKGAFGGYADYLAQVHGEDWPGSGSRTYPYAP